MHWKKSFLAALCATALILGLSMPPAQASSDIIFIALNEQIVSKITASTMPIVYNYSYYVPYVIFDMNYMSTNFGFSEDLGFRVAAGNNTIMLYNKRKQLIYDLAAGTCTDSQGNSYKSAVIRGGVTYLPVAAVQEFFADSGLSFSQRSTAYGDLLRLTTPSMVLSDAMFTDAAEYYILPKILRDYNRSQTPSPSPSPSPSTSPLPSPSPSPSPSPGQEPDKRGVRVNLSFLVSDGEGTGQLLDLLDRAGLSALFLFEPETLAENEALVRRVVGTGNAVGLALSGGPAEDAKAQLLEGNRLLGLIARVNTRTVTLKNSDKATAAALESEGWSVWQSNIAPPSASSASAYSAALLRSVDGKETAARLQLDDSPLAVAALPLLLNGLGEEGYSIRLAVGGELS